MMIQYQELREKNKSRKINGLREKGIPLSAPTYA